MRLVSFHGWFLRSVPGGPTARAGSRRAWRPLRGLRSAPVVLAVSGSAGRLGVGLADGGAFLGGHRHGGGAIIGGWGRVALPPSVVTDRGRPSVRRSAYAALRAQARASGRTEVHDRAWSSGGGSAAPSVTAYGLDHPAGIGELAEPFVDPGAALAGGLDQVRDGRAARPGRDLGGL
jgi:hypothetical protein